MKKYPLIILLGLLCLSGALAQELTDIALLIRDSKIEEAQALLEDLADSSDPEAILFLRGMLATSGNTATGYYDQLVEEYKNSRFCDDALLRLGQLRHAQGLYRSTIATFQELVKNYPSSPLKQTCYYWIGLSYQAVVEPDSATHYLRRAADTIPNSEISAIAYGDLRQFRNQANQNVRRTTTEPSIQYAVQVGAFAAQTNALLRKSYFEQKGYDVRLRTKIRDGSTLYLVWVGSFDNREDAYRYGEQIKRKFGISYTLVSE